MKIPFKYLIAFIGVVIIAVGCREVINSRSKTTSKMIKVISLERIKELTFEEAKKEFPDHLSTDEFRLTSGVEEFRIELLNYFDINELDKNNIKIRETTWRVSESMNLTVWYNLTKEQWRYIHHLEWNKESEF